jgi:hypothetical protein
MNNRCLSRILFGVLACIACMSASAPLAAQPQTMVASPAASDEDASYIRMAVATAGLIKEIASGRSVAVYQTNSQSPVMRGLVNGAIETYGFRELRPGDEAYQCTPQQRRARSMMDALPNCTIDVAEILIQFNSVQMTKDSGYVGGLMTQAVRGETRPRTTAFCLMSARRGPAWMGTSHTVVPTPRDCADDRKH